MELLAEARGADARYDRFLGALERDPLGEIALAVQAALFIAYGPAASSEAFLASRLATGPPAAFGTLPRGLDLAALTARVFD
jgi:putative acyl-CoA dehydrogenase